MVSFSEFGPQNSMAAIPEGINGDTWHHIEECVKVKQLRVERVAIVPRSWSILPLAEWIDSM
jgi:hypothetical protein